MRKGRGGLLDARRRMTNRHGYLALFAAQLVRLHHVLDAINATTVSVIVSIASPDASHLPGLNCSTVAHKMATSYAAISRHRRPLTTHINHRTMATDRRNTACKYARILHSVLPKGFPNPMLCLLPLPSVSGALDLRINPRQLPRQFLCPAITFGPGHVADL